MGAGGSYLPPNIVLLVIQGRQLRDRQEIPIRRSHQCNTRVRSPSFGPGLDYHTWIRQSSITHRPSISSILHHAMPFSLVWIPPFPCFLAGPLQMTILHSDILNCAQHRQRNTHVKCRSFPGIQYIHRTHFQTITHLFTSPSSPTSAPLFCAHSTTATPSSPETHFIARQTCPSEQHHVLCCCPFPAALSTFTVSRTCILCMFQQDLPCVFCHRVVLPWLKKPVIPLFYVS